LPGRRIASQARSILAKADARAEADALAAIDEEAGYWWARIVRSTVLTPVQTSRQSSERVAQAWVGRPALPAEVARE
jgi:hypothetical protein